jgi:hypothetical protein
MNDQVYLRALEDLLILGRPFNDLKSSSHSSQIELVPEYHVRTEIACND